MRPAQSPVWGWDSFLVWISDRSQQEWPSLSPSSREGSSDSTDLNGSGSVPWRANTASLELEWERALLVADARFWVYSPIVQEAAGIHKILIVRPIFQVQDILRKVLQKCHGFFVLPDSWAIKSYLTGFIFPWSASCLSVIRETMQFL